MRCCAVLPWGGVIYRHIQKAFGRLGARPMSRLPGQAEMAKWILEYRNAVMPICRDEGGETNGGETDYARDGWMASPDGWKKVHRGIPEIDGDDRMIRMTPEASDASLFEKKGVEGKRFFEVGTGHVPVAPIGWFLCGAGSVVTVDLHRRLEKGLTRKSLEWMAEHRDEVFGVYAGVVDEGVFDERFAVLIRFQHDPFVFFREAGIQYLAPMDAARTNLPDESIDFHFSITVLEHIPKNIIKGIFLEAKRILKPTGAAAHFVDLSDHFQHQDPSISKINFLRYSEAEWQRIAGNEFAYCNRIRPSDYISLFQEQGFSIVRQSSGVDWDSLGHLQKESFLLDRGFLRYGLEDLCSISLKVLLEKATA